MAWDIHALFRNHSKEIIRSLRRRGLPAETAADIAQDTFVRLMAGGTAIETVANPRAFLFQVSRNLSIDLERRQKRHPLVELSDEAFEAVADPAPSAEKIVYDRQRLAITEAALAELPERTRKAFEMHRVDERRVEEIGQELGLSAGRTWALIREAYFHIRTRLNEAST